MPTKFTQIMKFSDSSEDDIRYDHLGDEKFLLEHPEAETVHRKKGWRGRATMPYALTLALLLISVALNVVVLSELHENSHKNTLEGYDSPVLRDIGTHYETRFINGSIDLPNKYRGKPSQEVDDAWLALGTNYGSIVIPVDDGAQYGIKEGQVQRVAEQGGGYMADLHVFHDLQCLNLIRQTSHFSWDYYKQKAGTDEAPGTAFEAYEGEEQLETHSTHCLDMLRQQIMCKANIAVLGQWYVKDEGASKDFGYSRQCKDFDAIQQWFLEHRVDMAHTLVRHRPGDPILAQQP